MPEDFLERLRDVFGASQLPDLPALDPDNDVHLEQAADLLVRRFESTNDFAAYELLVDLAGHRIARMATRIAQDIGLAEDPDELVVAYYEYLFVNVTPTAADAPRFLTRADAWMREHAETLVRDIALSEVTDPTGAVRWDDQGVPRETAGQDGAHARATRICFHRLDLAHRQVLRASQVDGLPKEEIAKHFKLSVPEVEALLLEAVDRLDRAIEKALEGGSP